MELVVPELESWWTLGASLLGSSLFSAVSPASPDSPAAVNVKSKVMELKYSNILKYTTNLEIEVALYSLEMYKYGNYSKFIQNWNFYFVCIHRPISFIKFPKHNQFSWNVVIQLLLKIHSKLKLLFWVHPPAHLFYKIQKA